MNPAHLSMLLLVRAGHIALADVGSGPRVYRHDGSPVEAFTTSVLDDLFNDGFVESPEWSDTLKPTDSGWAVLDRTRSCAC